MGHNETRHAADAHRFVYVSDKAVKPASIMGATKRVGEMIVQALAHETETEFAIVRFGNVLGSRGNLVPTGPGTVRRGDYVRLTHHEMQRCFIRHLPEADASDYTRRRL